MTRRLELTFSPTGTADLTPAGSDRILWSSDDDDDWQDQHPNEQLGAADADDVFDYLETKKIISPDESEICEIYEESLDGDADSTESDAELED